MKAPIVIDYYSDLLCVWSWVLQPKIEKLIHTYQDQIDLRYHYMDVFGDTQTKMDNQWSHRGSFQGFSGHVKNTVDSFENVHVYARIWQDSQPKTSANVHLVLKAIELAVDGTASKKMALCFRESFYLKGQDIGDLGVLLNICLQNGINTALINDFINDGSAMASLMSDYHMAKVQSFQGSPTLILDEGRQILFGNISFEVLSANVQALLENKVSSSH